MVIPVSIFPLPLPPSTWSSQRYLNEKQKKSPLPVPTRSSPVAATISVIRQPFVQDLTEVATRPHASAEQFVLCVEKASSPVFEISYRGEDSRYASKVDHM